MATRESMDRFEVVTMSHPTARNSPTSPARLYIMAARAAVLASLRVNHQPIRRKDMKPTPSQPISS